VCSKVTDTHADDELWNVASSEDDFLGLDHADRTRTLRNGVGDLFLR
jgi:ubiquitin carboxyl-terminal hydrolase 7